ncbi:hypothetical protein [Streptomyces lavendofoliae]|uniref:Uncharacterized protein n=1 Tax=Streptomyces lavendofoliae TaxID=67314 RepID=A0A918I521_9ACTN|nr:hypothetical protein [Streptomyces lavendofoliae]GGU61903.1 hypothetical protein GCM10010274_58340 [Streptomyces lavendofoliae]
MPYYRVESTTSNYPSPNDWEVTLVTTRRKRAMAAVSSFDDRPYPNRTRWQRLIENDAIVVIRGRRKPRIECAGRDSSGVQRWWIRQVDKDGIGSSSSAAGPLPDVFDQIMRSHQWYIERHRLGRA